MPKFPKEKPTMSEDATTELFQEIGLCEKIIDTELLPKMQEGIQRYTGEWTPTHTEDWHLKLNEAFPNVQIMMHSIFFQNPKVFARPTKKNYFVETFNTKTGRKEKVVKDAAKSARTQEAAHNWLMKRVDYKSELRKINQDAAMYPYGVSWKGYVGDFGLGDDGSVNVRNEQIFYKRWRPDWLLWDPAATSLKPARWMGRKFEMPLMDVKEDERFKLNANIKGKRGFNKVIVDPKKIGGDFIAGGHKADRKNPLHTFASREFQESARARFLMLYEIWLRPTRKERLAKRPGRVVVIIREQKNPLDIRWWPYDMEGFPGNVLAYAPLNDSFVGVSELLTYADQMDEKTSLRNYQLKNARAVSNLVLGVDKNKADEEDIESYRQGTNHIIGTNGNPNEILAKITMGSISAEFYLADKRVQEDMDRVSGIADITRGVKTPGESTATEVRERTAGTAIRPKAKIDILSDFIVADQVQFNGLIKQFFTLPDIIEITGDPDPEYVENLSKDDIQAEIEIEIDVFSILPESPEMEKKSLNDTLNLAIGALREPTITQKLGAEGFVFNLHPILRRLLTLNNIRDPEVFRRIRPEESKGFVSVAELEAAQANILALFEGQSLEEIPNPPQEGQDHQARLRVYNSILTVLSGMAEQRGEKLPALDSLQQLIKLQMEVAEEESKNKAPRSGDVLGAPAGVQSQAANPKQLDAGPPSFDRILQELSR